MTLMRFILLSGVATLLMPAIGNSPGVAADAKGDATPADAICARLEPGTPTPFEADDLHAVTDFYAQRACKPVWVDERGPTQAATQAIREIDHAADWGLSASDFQFTAIRRPLQPAWTPDQTADAEFELTAAVLRYAHQAQGGRIMEPDKKLSSYLDRRPQLTEAEDVLAAVTSEADPTEILRSYQPPQPQFLKLKALLADMRSKVAKPAAPTIASDGPMLMVGTSNPDVAVLKSRFGLTSAVGDEAKFDETLAAAIRKFQQANGLGDDGIVGPLTRAALAGDGPRDTASRIGATIANMEEWRWMPRDLGATHVFVNIPSFTATLKDNDKAVIEERIVAGTPSTQTPVFSKDMTTIVLRPPWYLPDSIKVSTLLSGRSIESQGYVVMRNGHVVQSWRIDWSRANIDEYSIYQPSGDDNALGLVKMLFPNRHSVYLHDTPAKGLFEEPVRLYSHGCMRVRNPQQFAQAIFDIDRGAGMIDVKTLVRKGPLDNQFTLMTPIPVHVGYFTVWVDDSNEPHFYKDYYGHQQRITLALAGRWNEIDIGDDHLAAVDTSMLRKVRLGSDDDRRSRKKSDGADEEFDPPSGVTKTLGNSVKYRPYGDTVGDMIRRSLSN